MQFLFYLNPKFEASSSFLSLYRPVCVGPGRKPRRPVFSRRGSNDPASGVYCSGDQLGLIRIKFFVDNQALLFIIQLMSETTWMAKYNTR